MTQIIREERSARIEPHASNGRIWIYTVRPLEGEDISMTRIAGVEANEANLLTRVAYGVIRKKVGKVVMPIKVHAHHPKLFRGHAFMEMAQDKANELDWVVKTLV